MEKPAHFKFHSIIFRDPSFWEVSCHFIAAFSRDVFFLWVLLRFSLFHWLSCVLFPCACLYSLCVCLFGLVALIRILPQLLKILGLFLFKYYLCPNCSQYLLFGKSITCPFFSPPSICVFHFSLEFQSGLFSCESTLFAHPLSQRPLCHYTHPVQS